MSFEELESGSEEGKKNYEKSKAPTKGSVSEIKAKYR